MARRKLVSGSSGSVREAVENCDRTYLERVFRRAFGRIPEEIGFSDQPNARVARFWVGYGSSWNAANLFALVEALEVSPEAVTIETETRQGCPTCGPETVRWVEVKFPKKPLDNASSTA